MHMRSVSVTAYMSYVMINMSCVAMYISQATTNMSYVT